MGELQTVSDIPSIKVWNNQRVVTFKDIDEVHQRPSGTARKAFNRNRKRFIKDIDYFIVTRSDFQKYVKDTLEIQKSTKRTLENDNFGNIPNRGITVLTETGYLMVVKPFTDDLSWEVQRRLVNGYFKGREMEQSIKAQQTKKQEQPQLPQKHEWLVEHEDDFRWICRAFNFTRKQLYHQILLEIDKKYNVDEYKILYKSQVGHAAEYIMEVVAYFENLREEAEKVIFMYIEIKMIEANKKNFALEW